MNSSKVQDKVFRAKAPKFCFDCQREAVNVVRAIRTWDGAEISVTVVRTDEMGEDDEPILRGVTLDKFCDCGKGSLCPQFGRSFSR